MDVTLALNDIGIRKGLKGYKRKSSTFCLIAEVVGLFAFKYQLMLRVFAD